MTMRKLIVGSLVAAALGSVAIPAAARTNVDFYVNFGPPPIAPAMSAIPVGFSPSTAPSQSSTDPLLVPSTVACSPSSAHPARPSASAATTDAIRTARPGVPPDSPAAIE